MHRACEGAGVNQRFWWWWAVPGALIAWAVFGRGWQPPTTRPRPAVFGAGATFPAPLYARWFSALQVREGLSLSYDPVDSGQGVDQLVARLVDFAGTDRDSKTGMDARLADPRWLRIPVTAGAIAVAYNQPNCQLQLSRAQLRLILNGRIRNYQQLGCSPFPITVLVRSDASSGTTANLLAYLQHSGGAWHASTVNRVVSNDAMVTALAQQPGAVGYLETVYLNGRPGLRAAALQNASGAFVRPDDKAIQIALEQDERDPGAYPLTTYSWLVMPRRGLGAKGVVLKQAIAYGLSPSGQASARTLGYAALPNAVLQSARRSLEAWHP